MELSAPQPTMSREYHLMEITAAYLSGANQPFEVTMLHLDPPKASEVLVRSAATGICASVAHTRSGRIPSQLPCVLGHEGAGVVEAVGENVIHVAVGDHVALSWMPNCGQCRHCVSGRPGSAGQFRACLWCRWGWVERRDGCTPVRGGKDHRHRPR